MSAMAIKVPALGESVTEATVAKWFKQVGDAVKADEAVVELETDKVTVEVYAPEAGVISEISAGEGTNIEVGGQLGMVDADGTAANSNEQSASAEQEKPQEQPAAAEQDNQAEQKQDSGEAILSPAAKRLASEQNINPADIKGSGKDGRVTKEDVANYQSSHQSDGGKQQTAPAVQQTAPAPEQKPAQKEESKPQTGTTYPYQKPDGPREERVKMSRLRQRIAERLKQAQDTAAMLTTFNEVDMSGVMALRSQYKDDFAKRHGIKLGFMGFFVKAAIQALQDIPAVNAEIDGDEIVYKNFYDIGVAVGTDAGLVVPVVRDADALSLSGVEQAIADLAGKARGGKLAVSDMTGGTFTITNGGVYGSLMSTPILNTPQSGILGLHKIQERPVVVDGKMEVRPMMYLALSYDHRIVDGKEAVSFLVRIKDIIEDPQRLLLAI